MRQLFEYHPSISYRFIPGLRLRVEHEAGGYLVRTNGSGFRCEREFVAPKTAGKRRVLVFGDSITAGDAVSNPKRYTDLLERLIPDLEVYNFGLPGTGTDQQYLVWREFARLIEADAVVLTVPFENIRRVNSRSRQFIDDQGVHRVHAKPYFELDAGSLKLCGIPVPRDPLCADEAEPVGVAKTGRFRPLRDLVNKLGLRDAAQKLTGYQPLPEYDDPLCKEWSLMKAVLLAWIRQIPQPVLLIPFPVFQYIEETADPTACVARFREVAEEAGCHRHDLLPDLRRYACEERRAFRFPTDIHPTPSGHEAVARSVFPMLQGLLPDAR
ncbi:MAG: SGNH/GDSL hydrolase family protein [Bacteriovorax sp.]|nr:SGNH/GDSL hydrolase family protein [Rhizobacter sp.]